jgi:thymidylate synthase (FAD)
VQEPGVEGAYKAARDAAAVSYQTDTNKMKLAPKDFCEQVLMTNGHGRPMEFGTVYLKVEIPTDMQTIDVYKYNENKYTKVNQVYDADTEHIVMYVTTNLRVLMQGDYDIDQDAWKNGYDKNWFDDLKYWCEPTEHHFRRHTFTMLMSRGCTDDFRTHIEQSSICESTRYCNYSKGKYGNELTFIWPYWIDADMDDFNNGRGTLYEEYKAMRTAGCTYDKSKPDATIMVKYATDEEVYLDVSDANKLGLRAEQAKLFFPLGGKAELRLCGFDDAWRNFFWRRCDGHADPECQKTAKMLADDYFAKPRR